MKKTILTVLFSLFFSLNGQSINFTPRLSTEEGDIKISSVSVDVKVISNIAVTTIEMNFYNPLPRVLEGEFSFPLAQGQSLSRFALEINGVLREGVTVDKNEGQKIFESIVRRGVDPGLLEMTQGNSFRSRVYPIPSQGYKKIVIAYEETLVRNEKGFRYLFPFTFDYPITLFIFNADVLNQEIIPYIEENDFAKFTFTKNQKNYNTGFKKNNFILSRPVSFTIPSSEKADSIFTEEKADTTYFYSNISVKPLTKSKKIPEKLCIAWDSSGSGGKRNVSAEIQIIEKYIKKMGKGTVTLIPFAEDIYEHTEFVFENGKSTDLISKLKATVFDGGTQLGALNLNSFTCDEILLFSDGISNFGKEEIGLSKVPVFIINSSIEAEHAYLRSIALKTGGEYINLAATGIDAAFASLENYSYRFISASYDHSKVKELFPKLPEKIEGGFSFAGILLEPTAEITLNFGFGNEIIESRKIIVEKHPNLTTTGYLRRIWAEKKISELYINLEKNRPEITQLGKDFGIVTNFTSLIVLETVQDYVRYGVEPPEEMKKEYNDQKNAMLKTSKESNLADLEDIFFKFKMIIEWWTGKKSKEEQKIENITETSNENRQPLREGISDAPILRKSLGDEGRTGARRSRVANAQSSARRGLDSSGAAKFDRVFGGGGLDAGMERSLGSVTGLPGVDQFGSGGLSVRGFGTGGGGNALGIGGLKKRGRAGGSNVRIKQGEAVVMGALDRSIIYAYVKRDLAKIRWCFEKKLHKDPDLSGKIVINFIISSDGSVSSSKVFRTTMGDPDVEECIIKTIGKIRFPSPIGGGIVIVNYPFVFNSKDTPDDDLEIPQPDIEEKPEKEIKTDYIKLLKRSSDTELYSNYLIYKKENLDNPLYFLDAAEIFIERKMDKTAIKIISNLAEAKLEDYQLLRILAKRLSQIGKNEIAVKIFEEVLKLRAEEPQSYRDLGLAYEKTGMPQKALEMLYKVVTTKWDSRFSDVALIALNEMNALIAKNRDKINIDKIDNRFIAYMPVDIRVVLDWDSDNTDIDLWVIDPKGEKCFYSNKNTAIGGRISNDFTGGYGPEEFILKNAIPGKYKIYANYFTTREQTVYGPTTLHVSYFTNYSRKNEEEKVFTLKLKEKSETVTIGEFEFKPSEKINYTEPFTYLSNEKKADNMNRIVFFILMIVSAGLIFVLDRIIRNKK